MADSAVSTQSRPPRAASPKQRQATVSTETEKKLARAARSAQRLAQLSDVPRDDSTLDLFPDDPTRATLEAMNIDVRQGTLHGFELPDVVLAAVGALDPPADNASPDAKAARRAPRAVRADEPAAVNAQLSGLEIESSTEAEPEVGPKASAPDLADEDKAVASARDAALPLPPAMAAATVARSVTALRQAAAERGGATADTAAGATSEASGKPSPLVSETTVAGHGEAATAEADATNATNARTEGASLDSEKASARETKPPGGTAASAQARASFAVPWQEAQRVEAAAAASRAAPELDRARATAFADTVDALYGVIADQRRAATDHSRRMKWMLSIVVGALLMTVAIGITQTLLLMRLTRETTAQQHRVEQMMQNQQAATASLLDTQMAMAKAAAANAARPPTAPTAPVLAASQQAAAPASTNGKRAARAQHAHKPKTANSH
ncbi:hypothetical protein [Paraburkholderia rhynchosiae]|nr:hypothetical protein [Paraburkholderia rhynchosiae]PMS31167.1 hypothetical protein C0Z16_12950 [Paraburkholderia rhynchosiae]